MLKIRTISITSLALVSLFSTQIISAELNNNPTSKLTPTNLNSEIKIKTKNDFFEQAKASAYFQTVYVDLDSKANKGNLFAFEVISDMTLSLSDKVNFRFEGGGSFEKGSSDSLFDNSPLVAENRLQLKRAEFKWDVNENISLMAGAINSKALGQHLLLSHRGSLLGTKQTVRTKIGNLGVKLSATQAIPTNRNYSNKLDEVDEGNPEFFLESLNLQYGAPTNALVYNVSHFAFNNLSNSAASYSRFIGNSTYVYDKDNAEFIYSYQGWTQNIGYVFQNSSMLINPFANFVENTAAPENNKATVYGFKGTYLKGDKEYSLIATKFRAEADATVAYYQSKAFFHVNHEGQSLSLIYEDKTEGLMAKLVFGQMKEIEINQLNDRDESNAVVFLLRKNYDLF